MTREQVVSPQSRSASQRQHLAHRLLIELLSYQLAFPVRWIETQNSFLRQTPLIERYVEVGPSRVLANMAKKQAAKAQHAESHLEPRQFLSSSDNQKEIFYHYDEEEDSSNVDDGGNSTTPADSSSEPPLVSSARQPPVAVPATITAAPPVTSSAAPPMAIADTPLTAMDVLVALVAQKLRKQFDQVAKDKSIRELSGGKSTLQNEIVGDLGVEFGNIPDGCEDMPLATLAGALAGSFKGQPGKQMSALISKLVSSKMPASFNQQAIRQHLGSRWGLGAQRQTAVICFSITLEPPSRLANIDAAKEFFDTVVQGYSSFAQIQLSVVSASASASAQPTLVDAAALQSARKEHQDSLLKIHEVIGKLLEQPGDNTHEQPNNESKEGFEEKLNHWISEFGDDMYIGTSPIFDVRKIRVYDSWWNWVRVDLTVLKHELGTGQLGLNDAQDRLRMILNRWTPTCDQLLKSFPVGHTLVKNLKAQANSVQSRSPVFIYTKPAQAPRTRINAAGKIIYEEVPRETVGQGRSFAQLVNHGLKANSSGLRMPVIQLKNRHGDEWKYNGPWTDVFMEHLIAGETSGLSFSGTTALVTGAGPGSIACDIVKGLLEGGAEVLVTTSRPPPAATTKFFDEIYKTHGSKGSKLIVLPFNQGSKQDCEALINHIYGNNEGYGGDLDLVIPFAAIGETGQLDGLDSKSELAHRLMLTNLLRMLGYIKQQKEKRNLNTRPATVFLPLSPNHGTFGGDGLYSESKLGLETLFNRFHSESWSDYLTICGTVIGWTRGTGLMNTNNILAESVESENTLTFSPSEMAFSILALIHPQLIAIAENEPILADLSGNLSSIQNFKSSLTEARRRLSDRSKLQQALNDENDREDTLLRKRQTSSPKSIISPLRRRQTLEVGYPSLSDFNTMTSGLPDLQGMVDLKRTIVVVGFSELGPWGSSRTRWEMEHSGDFTDVGMLEIAWVMGLVEHFNGEIKGSPYVGWVDSKTKEPIHEDEIRSKFGKYVMEHTGVRFVEPDILEGYDPNKKEFLHEVVMDEDLPTFEASKTAAEAFRLQHGDKVSISPIPGSEDYQVRIKKGARLLIPKAISFNRKVAGQLPSGWDPTRYGIPDDMITQVDPTTLYTLCCVCEAMYSAGIEDPFEIYRHMHVSELANCLGTGAGGLTATRKMYRERYMEHPANSDIFQETFLNSIGAWSNLLLLSSTGPLKTPSGACATAIESMDSGCESILLGKAKMAFVGGTDDFREEASYEFGNMKATVNTDEEVLNGRPPKEMCRPSTTTRSGFMEAAGCGVQIITTADMALKMGLPIYAIVAHIQMASDSIGRSIPAPGQGLLTAAREVPGAAQSPLLSLEYRRGKLNEAVRDIDAWWTRQLQLVKSIPADDIEGILRSLETLRACKIADAQNLWGSNFRQQDPQISPIRAALAVWGLTVDDIGVASLHGTSTKANDKNEADVINKQMTRLGRSLSNPLMTISQKYLTGHPKGAAGAWMFNGGIQVLQTGIVPGNRNADNIDTVLQKFEHLIYSPETIHTSGIKALMLTSFGFGQKGGIVVAIAPKYVFAAISEGEYQDYKDRVVARQQKTGLEFIRGIMSKSLFKAKKESAWKNDESAVFLDPRARAVFHSATSEFVVTAESR